MALQWERFLALDGSPQRNLELLCRAIVQRNFGRFGKLRSRRQQPGIEFHLELTSDCALGQAGRWFGWQCRWYELPASYSLGQKRRADILDAIAKAKADVDGLTDFVLCLRELPRSSDLDWFHSLDVGLTLHCWADEEIEAHLTGDAEILRRTYFGELVLSRAQLDDTRSRTIESAKQRWVPGLHVRTSIEELINASLARPTSAQPLWEQGSRLDRIAGGIRAGIGQIHGDDLRRLAEAVADDAATLSSHLRSIGTACDDRHPREVRELIGADARPTTTVRDARGLARRLRNQRVPVAVWVSTFEADVRHALALLGRYAKLITAPLIAIVGNAGEGKTQLAAQLTAPTEDVPAGVFLRGFDLPIGGAIDDLASRLPGVNPKTFDELLEALEAAGARDGIRLPIVIDGLNDAERPTDWGTQLGQLMPILGRFDHVLMIVTLRGAVRDVVVPTQALTLELEWQKAEVEEAVAKYFAHYRIAPGSARLPMGLLAHPLFLRMFCEATNPDRAQEVGVEALPASLTAVFDVYLRQIAERLRKRPAHPSMPEGHIEKHLAKLASALWTQGVRDLPFDEVKLMLDTPGTNWDGSLVRALEEEGILFRDHPLGLQDERSAFVFDRLAGHVIADTLIRRLAIDQLNEEMASAELWRKLQSPPEAGHPLAEDILVALVGLLPRRSFGQQLWKLAPDDYRDWALAQALDLESRFHDKETVDALADWLLRRVAPQRGRRQPFDRLWEIRDGFDHQLNAGFLDSVLRRWSVAGRDLRWTEWIRANADQLDRDLQDIETRWSTVDDRGPTDDLNARAVAWLLTTTRLPLRDRATRALQRYARPDPTRLFTLAGDLLDVNDPYVIERLLAASFGAATDHQMPDPGGAFERSLRRWLEELTRRYVGPRAATPTSHQLARQYVLGCFELASCLHPAAVPAQIDPVALDFAAGPQPDPIRASDGRSKECDETFGMDFENYVVGPLFEGRGNYQSSHPQFLAGLAQIRGRVWELGWRSDLFAETDQRIATDHWRQHQSPQRTERYGKKYGWIGYFELAGRLSDRGALRDRTAPAGRGVWPDIDPSFPEVPPQLAVPIPAWANGGPDDPSAWYSSAEVDIPDELLVADVLEGEQGPWVLVEAWLQHVDHERARRVWGFIRGVLVKNENAEKLREQLEQRPYLGNDYVPDAPADHATFAGEMPWSARFAAAGQIDSELEPYHALVTEKWGEPGTEIELLGHGYEISASRTTTNLAPGLWVPSHEIASAFGLRKQPGTLDFVGLDGRRVSMTRSAPPTFDGGLLYIRQELVAKYARDHDDTLVQLAWGERQIDVGWQSALHWMENARLENAELWRRVRLTEL